MNAGRRPLRDQGDQAERLLPFPEGGPRTKEKRRGEMTPQGAPARVMGWPFPPARGTGADCKVGPPGAAFRTSACRPASPPSDWGDIPQGCPAHVPPGTMDMATLMMSTKLSKAPSLTYPSSPSPETTRKPQESVLAERTRGLSRGERRERFGETNPRVPRSTFPRRPV